MSSNAMQIREMSRLHFILPLLRRLLSITVSSASSLYNINSLLNVSATSVSYHPSMFHRPLLFVPPGWLFSANFDSLLAKHTDMKRRITDGGERTDSYLPLTRPNKKFKLYWIACIEVYVYSSYRETNNKTATYTSTVRIDKNGCANQSKSLAKTAQYSLSSFPYSVIPISVCMCIRINYEV